MPSLFARRRRLSDASGRSSTRSSRNGRPPVTAVDVDLEPLPRMPAKFRQLLESHGNTTPPPKSEPTNTTKTKKDRRMSIFAWRSTVDLRKQADVQAQADTDRESIPATTRPLKIPHEMPSLGLKEPSSPPDSAVITPPTDDVPLPDDDHSLPVLGGGHVRGQTEVPTSTIPTSPSPHTLPPAPQSFQPQEERHEQSTAADDSASVELAEDVPTFSSRFRSDTVSSRPALSIDTALSRDVDVFACATGSTHYGTPEAMTPVGVASSTSAHEGAFLTPLQHTPMCTTGEGFSVMSTAVERSRSMDLGRPSTAKPRRTSTSGISRAAVTPNMSPFASPRKLSMVLTSPPMPQPIAHLPTLQPSTPGSAGTAVWGALALEGGPRSPALSRTTSHETGVTTAFPFFGHASLSQTTSRQLTDSEIAKATKAMPVMFRVASRTEQLDEGGEAEELNDSEEGGSSAASTPMDTASMAALRNKGKGVAHMDPLVEESPTRAGSRVSTPKAPMFGEAGILGLDVPPAKWQGLSDSAIPDAGPSSMGDCYFGHIPASSSSNAPSSVPESTTPGVDMDDSDSVAESNETEGDSSINTGEGENDEGESCSAPHTTLATPATPTASGDHHPSRPPLYSHISHSTSDLPSPNIHIQKPLLDTVPETALSPVQQQSKDSTLKRRLSAGDADPPPPLYEPIKDYVHDGPKPKPREEEGREGLPPYWCGVHIEGTLSRKMEFTQPGVQAKDRGWKKYYLVLHGTALFVYKFDPYKVPLRAGEPYITCSDQEAENFLHVHPAPDRRSSTPVLPAGSLARPSVTPRSSLGAAATATRPEKQMRRNTISLEGLRGTPLGQTFQSRRGTVGSHTPTRREGTPPVPPIPEGPDFKDPELFNNASPRKMSTSNMSVASSTASAPIASHMPFAHNMLVHKYTLQNAESGLAADYKKRLHCVRIRAEGQQFMLQTDTARQCVQWIEAFQAATNVATDLDVRPMPVQQTLPRRRRRRAAAAARPVDPSAAPTSDNANPAFEDTPEGNLAAVEAAERSQAEADHERDRMLAEDQDAETRDANNRVY